MGSQVDLSDRRLHRRFKAPCNAFAVLHSDNIIVTSLADINMAGLAFDCMIECGPPLQGAKELDVFCADDDLYDFHLQNVAFEIVSAIKNETDDECGPQTARYGVKFKGLTPEQESRLRFFIKYHTVGETDWGNQEFDKNCRRQNLFDRISFVF